MRARPFLAVLVAGLTLAALVGASTKAAAGRACASGTRDGGYAYAGQQATHRGHGVRATITVSRTPTVEAGHVAGWVGVGGPGQGPNGEDEWLQAGIASLPGMDPLVYVEIARAGTAPEFVTVAEGVGTGESHDLAILEISRRPGWWRAWVDGRAVTDPIRLRGSSGRWAPIATAESWNAGTAACNTFGFRFERVSVSYGGGGSWRPFVPEHRFLDGGNVVRDLASARPTSGVYRSLTARTEARTILPYAFVATSG